MFGIEPVELFIFGKQFGFAIAGAASLWGTVFLWKKRTHEDKDQEQCLTFDIISRKLLIPFSLGVVFAAGSWAVLDTFFFPVHAHEGITLSSPLAAKQAAQESFAPGMITLVILLTGGLFAWHFVRELFYRNLFTFYAVAFLLIATLTSFSSWVGEFNRDQWFFIGHSVHSIFTLGTVIILDFLFLISRASDVLKRHIYPLFPTISKVIWVGLGLDFLSVALVFDAAVQFTPKFFFMQTAIGILILNGIFLGGPIARKMMASVEEGGQALKKKWMTIGTISGIVSVSSWTTNTFIDTFEHLSLGYLGLMLGYLGLISFLLIGHTILERFQKKPVEFVKAT